jgi:hypothetical protein
MRRRHRVAHWLIWLLMAALLPAVLLAGFALREDRAPDNPPVRLSQPLAG